MWNFVLGNILFEKLLAILLAASKKCFTRKWLKVDPPTIDEWIEIVYEIYVMEKISFSLKVEKDIFYKTWTKWTEYVKPVRSDFIWLYLCFVWSSFFFFFFFFWGDVRSPVVFSFPLLLFLHGVI